MPDGAVTIKIPRAVTLANVLSGLGVAAVAVIWGAKIDAGYTKHAAAIEDLSQKHSTVAADIDRLKIYRENEVKFQSSVVESMRKLEEITTKTQISLARIEK